MTCFVPSCNNSIGMPFPEDTGSRQRWMDNLKLDVEPGEKSFVCLDHFRPSDIIEQSDILEGDLNPENVRNLVVLRKGAVPFQDDDDANLNAPTEPDGPVQLCRACNGADNLERSIFETMENGTTIMSMIMLCCYPVVITKADSFPKFICTNCLKQLQKCFKFRSKCLKTNKLWNEKLKKQLKRKEEQAGGVSKKVCLEKPPTNEEVIAILQGPNYNEELCHEQNLENVKGDQKSPADEVEQISPTTSNEPTISPAIQDKRESDTKATKKLLPNITLPKGIRIINTTRQTFQSNVGAFASVHIKGPQDTDFALADGYLFTIGLVKGAVRYLKCIVLTCGAKGKEILTAAAQTDGQTFTLDVAHSHDRPDEQTRKKQMFFYIMRKRMQLAKSLNIRMIYEEICVQ